MNHNSLCPSIQSEYINSSLFRFFNPLNAVDALANHHAAHNVKHFKSAVAADDDVGAALVGEDAVGFDLSEDQCKSVAAVDC